MLTGGHQGAIWNTIFSIFDFLSDGEAHKGPQNVAGPGKTFPLPPLDGPVRVWSFTKFPINGRSSCRVRWPRKIHLTEIYTFWIESTSNSIGLIVYEYLLQHQSTPDHLIQFCKQILSIPLLCSATYCDLQNNQILSTSAKRYVLPRSFHTAVPVYRLEFPFSGHSGPITDRWVADHKQFGNRLKRTLFCRLCYTKIGHFTRVLIGSENS